MLLMLLMLLTPRVAAGHGIRIVLNESCFIDALILRKHVVPTSPMVFLRRFAE